MLGGREVVPGMHHIGLWLLDTRNDPGIKNTPARPAGVLSFHGWRGQVLPRSVRERAMLPAPRPAAAGGSAPSGGAAAPATRSTARAAPVTDMSPAPSAPPAPCRAAAA